MLNDAQAVVSGRVRFGLSHRLCGQIKLPEEVIQPAPLAERLVGGLAERASQARPLVSPCRMSNWREKPRSSAAFVRPRARGRQNRGPRSTPKIGLTSPSEKAILRAMGERRRHIRPGAYRQVSVRPNHRESHFTERVLFALLRDILPVARQTPDADSPYSCSSPGSGFRTGAMSDRPRPARERLAARPMARVSASSGHRVVYAQPV